MKSTFADRQKTALFTFLLVLVLSLSSITMVGTIVKAQPALLDPLTIPKYTNQLTGPPPVYTPKWMKNPNGTGVVMYYEVTMSRSMQQILPAVDEAGDPTGFGLTEVWGYGGQAYDALTGKPLGYVLNSPGPTFEAIRGIPTIVKWVNNISTPYMFAVDPTLHWANPNDIPMQGMSEAPTAPFPEFPPGFDGTYDPVTNPYSYDAQSPVPLVTHLHGGEVQSLFDGHPEAWVTYGGTQGAAYNTLYATDSNAAVFYYPNEQPATTLWYHDHGLGVTRLNVMSGLAGFYLLRDNADVLGHMLDSRTYEMPIVIQDRIFQEDGNFYFPSEGNNPDDHPYWSPEFFGDTIMVNGLIWPNMDVNRGIYRFRLLDGSNARFYTLSFVANPGETNEETLQFTQIGTDGGYMEAPVTMTELTIAPGERADVLVDFSGLAAGTKVLLTNTANAPFPDGDPEANADPETTGQIMQFTVTSKKMKTPLTLPQILNPDLNGDWPTLPDPTNTRTFTLWEVMSPADEPLEVLVNGQKWAAPISEDPEEGSTEDWTIVNLTGDTHPIHLHLVQFQLLSRQPIDAELYASDWTTINGGEPPYMFTPTELAIDDYTTGDAIGPAPNEYAWKDTIQMNPGEATTIRVRFAPIDGSAYYPFDPTVGPGYVWHCHILDHEDNEMMRPYTVEEPT